MSKSLTLRVGARVTLLSCLALVISQQAGCSGTPNGGGGGGSSAAGNGSAGGASAGATAASGGAGGVCAGRPASCVPLCEGGLCDCYCPGTGGGAAATGGRSGSGGATSGGAGGVCGSNCQVQSSTGAMCGTMPVTLICNGPFPNDLPAIMSANGCVDAGTNAVRYCCPSLILTQCQ
jgi:hypothetical protein